MSQRIKIIKDYNQYSTGEVVVVENNTAHALIEAGVAMLSKDMTSRDYKSKIMTKQPRKRK